MICKSLKVCKIKLTFSALWTPYLSDLLQLFIIFQEESQIHEGDINVRVTTVLSVLFYCVFSSRKCMFVYLQAFENRMSQRQLQVDEYSKSDK